MDESTSRTLSVLKHGADTGVSFRPLAKWKALEVFAFCAQNGLPLHPAYACSFGGVWPREHLRVHAIGGRSGTGMGRREWEMEYYPDVLRRIG